MKKKLERTCWRWRRPSEFKLHPPWTWPQRTLR